MTQEDKELLLKDLCARLPYKPKIKVLSLWNENKEVEEEIVDSIYCVMSDGYINTETIDSDISLDDIVLYLRPMSNMTREEQVRYDILVEETVYRPGVLTCFDLINFCHEHHLDNLGLIEKGLAIEAPAGMYE